MAVGRPQTRELRHKLTLEQKSTTGDGQGGSASETWASYATVWGGIEPLSGREALLGMSLRERVTHTVTLRHRTDVKHSHRITYGARVFQIRSVKDYREEGRWLILDVEEEKS